MQENKKIYRIKEEAELFFSETYRGQIQPLEWFVSRNISKNALDEIEDVKITYGWKQNDIQTYLSGWGQNRGSHIHFTINFPSIKYEHHKMFTERLRIEEMMAEIQKVVDKWYNI